MPVVYVHHKIARLQIGKVAEKSRRADLARWAAPLAAQQSKNPRSIDRQLGIGESGPFAEGARTSTNPADSFALSAVKSAAALSDSPST
jgi:hypothetical protein